MNGKAPTAVIDTALWASIATSKGTVLLAGDVGVRVRLRSRHGNMAAERRAALIYYHTIDTADVILLDPS